ncbi:MAG: hypothetical protein IJK14_08125 [Clostridia bacterium]|nr:hypothetical protein [Clostridia bacterium]
MKKIAVILICMLVILAGCAGKDKADIQPAVTAAPVQETGHFSDFVKTTDEPAVPSPEPVAEARDDSGLPIVYNVYDEVGFSVSEAEMFRYDIDGDGREEVISFRLDEDQYSTTILIDDQSLLFDESSMLRQVILIDLDPATPWINLLVEIDYASDDYFTTEVHMVNGKPVKGAQVGAVYVSGKTQLMYERTDFLGTRSGSCGFHGEQLTPDSDWYDCDVPTDEELRSERSELIEYGRLYHTVGEIPCTINGKSAKIAKNSYLYMTRFMPSGKLAEVRTVDGVTAVISYTESDWVYRIGGVPQDDLFDNLFYAD